MGSCKENVRIFRQPTSLRQIAEFDGHEEGVLQMRLSPEGDTLVTLGCDSTIKFWDSFHESYAKSVPRRRGSLTPISPLSLASIR